MERMEFDAPQERVTKGRYGEVLVLLNGRKERIATEDGGDGGAVREVWVYDGMRLETGGSTSEAALLAAAKTARLAEIEAYDTSGEVRRCIIGGRRTWIDRDTRVALLNSARIAAEQGEGTFTVWTDGTGHTMTAETAVSMLGKIEVYAQECYNVTAGHKAEVKALATIEAVAGYDVTAGYPEVLMLDV